MSGVYTSATGRRRVMKATNIDWAVQKIDIGHFHNTPSSCERGINPVLGEILSLS